MMINGKTSVGPSFTDSQHSFARIPSVEIQRSSFDRSCGLKTAFLFGDLVPVFLDEVLPGDTMAMRMQSFGRLTTMINPVMENMYLDFFFFFVPNRLVWNNWERFNGAKDNPDDPYDNYEIPTVPIAAGAPGVASGSLFDFLGIGPMEATNDGFSVCALFSRGYNLIWNEWFRDQNLQDSVVVDKDDGPDTYADYVLLKRGKRHDYFTSCLPFTQKGPLVTLPLTGTADITGTDFPTFTDGTNTRNIQGDAGAANNIKSSGTLAATNLIWADPGLDVNLTDAYAGTINELREAFQMQRMFERDARGGTRYTEILRSHFGVISPDQRLQRPEFLGGGTVRINVNPVPSTTYNTGATLALGELGAFGTASGQVGFRQSFTEHGFILGLVSARADLTYQQGIERMWFRNSRYDFYWPSFANLGEQAVYQREINATGVDTQMADSAVFGYQERYAEYRYKPSRVSGFMRSASSQPLDTWHLAQELASNVALNADFIEEDPPISRVTIVAQTTATPPLMLDAFFTYKCTRPMPTFGVPGLIDHF